MKKSLGTVETADCILLECHGKRLCIGTDKVGHFFQQGFMLWQICADFGTDGALYAGAFSAWTEGFYKKGTGALANKIDNWLNTGSFAFYGDEFNGRTQLSAYKNVWGGRIGAPPSNGDFAANAEGLGFWLTLEDYVSESLKQKPRKQFDICDFVSTKWEGQ